MDEPDEEHRPGVGDLPQRPHPQHHRCRRLHQAAVLLLRRRLLDLSLHVDAVLYRHLADRCVGFARIEAMTGATAASGAVRPPVPRPRVVGIILISIWLVIFAGLIAAFLSSITGERLGRYGPLIVSGFFTTIKLVAFSILIGAVISFAIAAGRLSRNPLFAALAYAYSYFFRGTPLIAQTFLIYYGAGQFALQLRVIGLWWFLRDAYDCAILAFAL